MATTVINRLWSSTYLNQTAQISSPDHRNEPSLDFSGWKKQFQIPMALLKFRKSVFVNVNVNNTSMISNGFLFKTVIVSYYNASSSAMVYLLKSSLGV